MRTSRLALIAILLLTLFSGLSQAAELGHHEKGSRATNFEFRDTNYFLRWSESGQFEFTPAGQEDLSSWKEMITVWLYPNITEGEGLAAQANAVLSNYKRSQGEILHTNSVPKTPESPAEHFIAAMLAGSSGGAQLLEFSAARFVLVDGKGVGIFYSRRSYGEQAPQELGEWVAQNGASVEKSSMEFDPSNVVSSLQKKK